MLLSLDRRKSWFLSRPTIANHRGAIDRRLGFVLSIRAKDEAKTAARAPTFKPL